MLHSRCILGGRIESQMSKLISLGSHTLPMPVRFAGLVHTDSWLLTLQQCLTILCNVSGLMNLTNALWCTVGLLTCSFLPYDVCRQAEWVLESQTCVASIVRTCFTPSLTNKHYLGCADADLRGLPRLTSFTAVCGAFLGPPSSSSLTGLQFNCNSGTKGKGRFYGLQSLCAVAMTGLPNLQTLNLRVPVRIEEVEFSLIDAGDPDTYKQNIGDLWQCLICMLKLWDGN